MDEVNIKYLSQFNPILIVPVLSAVIGAILVFVFGFKRPNEPRFQSSSSIDSLKKSKRKANTAKISDNTVQSSKQQIVSSAKVGTGKKATDTSAAVASKKGPTSEKSSNNNNNTSSSNNNISKKKTDEKKSENGSPAKKVANKKTGKENAVPISKKSKANKNLLSEGNGFNEKPADFDDGGWFTVQSKSTKQKNKVDESVGNQTENSSPKVQGIKNNKSAKGTKSEAKQSATQPITTDVNSASEDWVNEPTAVEPKSDDNVVDSPTPTPTPTPAPAPTPIVEEPAVVVPNEVIQVVEKKPITSVPLKATELNTENTIAFDELGEWTDAKPDRKKGNKKKSRKD